MIRRAGQFPRLLGAVAGRRAFYLDNWQSASPNAGPAISPEMTRRLNDPCASRPASAAHAAARADARAAKRPQRGLNENYAREADGLHTLGVDGAPAGRDRTARSSRDGHRSAAAGRRVRVPPADADNGTDAARPAVRAERRGGRRTRSICCRGIRHRASHCLQLAQRSFRRAAGRSGGSRGQGVPRHKGDLRG